MYLAPHVNVLYTQIRNRALCQVSLHVLHRVAMLLLLLDISSIKSSIPIPLRKKRWYVVLYLYDGHTCTSHVVHWSPLKEIDFRSQDTAG